ncbi:MAG: glycine cleavage system protein H [Cyclobacteriaceae bacterium]|nr:glycine cleavage system protein H [Cyclobacteriaceae bacterium]
MKEIDKYQVRTDVFFDPETHFWIDKTGNKAVVGMSPLVQETSGSFVAVLFNEMGAALGKGESFGTIEAEKHVGPLKMPVSGKTIVCNQKVIENPRLLNTDPFGEGWLMEIELSAFDKEENGLVSGEENITSWFQAELKKFDEKGWIAQQ